MFNCFIICLKKVEVPYVKCETRESYHDIVDKQHF